MEPSSYKPSIISNTTRYYYNKKPQYIRSTFWNNQRLNSTSVTNTYHEYFRNSYPSVKSTTSTNSSISSSTYSSGWNHYKQPIVMNTYQNVHRVLEDVGNYGNNVNRYYNNVQNFFSIP